MPTISPTYQRAVELHHSGRLREAEQAYRLALEADPHHAGAWHGLGIIAVQVGQNQAAIECLQRALQYRPDFAEACIQLGNVLEDQGQPHEAIAYYRRALQLCPNDANAHHNLGNVCQALGRLDEATACYQRALQLRPDYAEVHYNQGNVWREQRRADEAIACYRRAIELKPKFLQAYVNLGNAHSELGRSDDAVACFQAALRLKPNHANAQNNLGNVFKDQGKLVAAIACFRQALESDPNFYVAGSNLLHTLHFCPDYDAAAICEEHRRWDQQFGLSLAASIKPHANQCQADRRLRIGYVSPNFRDHVIGRNVLPLLRQHDHQTFEIFCYSDVLHPDALTEMFRTHSDAWRDSAGMTHQALAQLIRDDHIDILVDLTLHMARNRLPTFALKPAPVQVTFAGYPGATGLSTIDYRLTDVHLDPPGSHTFPYPEESIRLPDSFWCYDPLDREPAVNKLPALESGYVTFGCLNNFCKINAGVLNLWAKVLKQVDHSQIMLLATEGGHRKDTLDLLAREGIVADRVTFVGKQPRQRYLELYQGIDVGLDTFPYNGHTTSLDSYWMGVPVVTLLGQTEVGRAGLSQLTNLDLAELIGETPEQFVRIAVELAGDLPLLADLRQNLRARMQRSPLMDAPRFARTIEAAYHAMWRRWCGQ